LYVLPNFDVITCCVGSCDKGTINESDKIVFENTKKNEKIWKEIFTQISP